MTIKNYLSARFDSLGFVLNESDLIDMEIWDGDELLTENNKDEIYLKFINFIPSLLLRPPNLREGELSMSRATKDEITAFYSAECEKFGIKNLLLKQRSKIIFY